MTVTRLALDERFTGDDLDRDVWFPYYLPHWSSRSRSTATYALSDDGLHLSIPVDQPLWCPDLHDEPLRVSGIQSGSFAGPLGSTIGQQPFRDGLVVEEEQPTFWGYTPHYGHIEITMRGVIGTRSMFALWMSGIEDRPERSGEICVAEVFGDRAGDGRAEVGLGSRRFRDPLLTGDFSTISVDFDVADFHTYGVHWREGRVDFEIDGEQVRTVDESPDYPMQLMIAVFDFPAKAPVDEIEVPAPELIVSRVAGRPLS